MNNCIDPIAYIMDRVDQNDLLNQLAEECMELGYNGPMQLLEIQKKVNEKKARWVERLQEKEGREHDAFGDC